VFVDTDHGFALGHDPAAGDATHMTWRCGTGSGVRPRLRTSCRSHRMRPLQRSFRSFRGRRQSGASRPKLNGHRSSWSGARQYRAFHRALPRGGRSLCTRAPGKSCMSVWTRCSRLPVSTGLAPAG
jgi:hypothetical protein